MWAAERGHYNVVKAMMEHKLEVLTQDHQGATALHLAAYSGHAGLCQLLIQVVVVVVRRNGRNHLLPPGLQHGAAVDGVDSSGHTPLFRACERGHSETVLGLLQNGANVQLLDRDGRSCLHWAASGGHDFICTTLLHHGLPVDVADDSG